MEAAEDIQEAYSLHANCFVSKPVSALDFIKTMNLIADFWITVAKKGSMSSVGAGSLFGSSG